MVQSIQVYPQELSPLYLDINLDLDFITYTQNATITVDVNIDDKDIDYFNITTNVIPDKGNASLNHNYIMMSSNETKEIKFNATDVPAGEIEEYTITINANGKGYTTAIEEVEIQVKGPPDEEEDTPSIGTPVYIILILIATLLFRKRKMYRY